MLFADATNYDLLDLLFKAVGAVALFYTALRSRWNAGHLKDQDVTLAKQDATLAAIHEAVTDQPAAARDVGPKLIGRPGA